MNDKLFVCFVGCFRVITFELNSLKNTKVESGMLW